MQRNMRFQIHPRYAPAARPGASASPSRAGSVEFARSEVVDTRGPTSVAMHRGQNDGPSMLGILDWGTKGGIVSGAGGT